MRAITYAAVLGAGISVVSFPGEAKQASAIFGDANVQLTSKAQDKEVIGKGAYADYYGYYGIYYSYYAYLYGYYGYSNASASYYAQAYENASNAASSYYNAYVYQTYGY